MNTVTVIKEGYGFATTESGGASRADCTISLVRGAQKNILIDTGLPKDSAFVVRALKDEGLSVDDVHVVVGTHGHSDHIGNLSLFSSSLIIVSCDICSGDTYYENDLIKGVPYVLDTDIEVIPTPGHTGRDVSVVVRNTRQPGGTVVIAGDLFESETDIEECCKWMDVSENPAVQAVYRSKVLEFADYIVPGHGSMFKVTERHRELVCSFTATQPG